MSGVPVVLSGVPVDIPESFPLPHAELTGPETLSYRRCRRPLRAILAAEVEVWRGALRAVRGGAVVLGSFAPSKGCPSRRPI